LEKKYNQPFLHIPIVPIGAKETTRFLHEVSKFAGLDKEKVEAFIKKEEKRYYYYLEHFADFYAEWWWGLPAKFAVVGDSAYNLAVTKFLVTQLGLIPGKQIITENTPEEYQEAIRNEYKHISDKVSTDVEFIEDGYLILESLRNTDFGHKPPVLFATTWEHDVAKDLNASLVEIGFPASYEVVLSRSYVGYRGALNLLEKIYTTAISTSA
jgi:nitrogenase molybdenum-iron protein beta chain